jgi:uncharacterized protein
MSATAPLTIHPGRIYDDPVELRASLPPSVLDLNEPSAKGKGPVEAELTIQRDGESLIVTGRVATVLTLQCGRCGKWMDRPVEINPFVQLLEPPLADTVDLTPLVREDILLDLPAVAVCPPKNGKECKRFPSADDAPGPIHGEDVWKELDKIKDNDGQ